MEAKCIEGNEAMRAGDYPKAKRLYDEAAAISGERVGQVLVNRARCFHMLGMGESAKRDAEQVIRLAEVEEYSRVTAECLLHTLGEPTGNTKGLLSKPPLDLTLYNLTMDAKVDWVSDIPPSPESLAFSRGKARLKSRELLPAIHDFEFVLHSGTADPDIIPEILRLLIAAYTTTGDHENALKHAKRTSDSLLTAQCEVNCGLYHAAATRLSSTKGAVSDPETDFLLAVCYKEMGLGGKALQLLKPGGPAIWGTLAGRVAELRVFLMYQRGDAEGVVAETEGGHADNTHVDITLLRAASHHALGQYTKAAVGYRTLKAKGHFAGGLVATVHAESKGFHASWIGWDLTDKIDDGVKMGLCRQSLCGVDDDDAVLRDVAVPLEVPADLIREAEAFGKRFIQYDAIGFTPNWRTHRAAGLACWEAYHFLSTPNLSVKALYGVSVKWRQLTDRIDAVFWSSSLPDDEVGGLGLRTAMILNGKPVVKYRRYVTKALEVLKEAVVRQYILTDEMVDQVMGAETVEKVRDVMGRDLVVRLTCDGLDGVRLTVTKGDGITFAITSPCSPSRTALYTTKMTSLLSAPTPTTALHLYYLWANAQPLTRGTSFAGLTILQAMLLTHGIHVCLPPCTQPDWEAMLTPTFEGFNAMAQAWLVPVGPVTIPRAVPETVSDAVGWLNAR